MTTTQTHARRARLAALGVLVGALIAGPTVVAAQAPPPPPRTQADELRARAFGLYDQPDRWALAAELHRKAADLRDDADPKRVADRTSAARLYYHAGNKRAALRTMEEAADEALEVGDVLTSAHLYLDAALIAGEIDRGKDALRLVHAGELLTNSPLLSDSACDCIHNRIHRGERWLVLKAKQ